MIRRAVAGGDLADRLNPASTRYSPSYYACLGHATCCLPADHDGDHLPAPPVQR